MGAAVGAERAAIECNMPVCDESTWDIPASDMVAAVGTKRAAVKCNLQCAVRALGTYLLLICWLLEIGHEHTLQCACSLDRPNLARRL